MGASPAGSGKDQRRHSVALSLLGLALLAWTLVLWAEPEWRWSVDSVRLATAVTTTATVVAALGCLLAFVRYRFTGLRSTLAMAIAFAILLANLVLRIVEMTAARPVGSPLLSVYVWRADRFYAGLAFVAMVLFVRAGDPSDDRARGRALGWSAGAMLLLVVTYGGLWLVRAHLPALATGLPPNPTPVNIVTNLLAAAPYVAAAVVLITVRDSRIATAVWFPAAFLVAAAGQLQNLLFVGGFSTDVVTTPELLRLATWALLFVALVVDVAQGYASDAHRAERLEQLTREREQLSRILTHDLRHAISSMRNFAVGLERRWWALPDARRLEIVQRLGRETERVRDLADETVGVMSDGVPFVPEMRRESVHDLVLGAVEAFDDMATELQVQVDPGIEPVVVNADRIQIYQVLRNLLRNAFGHGGGHLVRLDVTGDDRHVRFRVVDDGPGFPAGVDGNGIRPQRPDPAADGWGVGLIICREIVEAHGGSIRVSTLEPHGAAVSFELPRAG